MKKLLIFCALFFTCVAAFCQGMISVQVVQNNPGQRKVWATSRFFEQSMLDYFFDSGKIASNSPIFIDEGDERKNAKALKKALVENRDGGMDYLVRVELFFCDDKSASPERAMLSNINRVAWTVYEVSSGAELFDGETKTGKVDSKNDNEFGIAKLARSIAEKSYSKISG